MHGVRSDDAQVLDGPYPAPRAHAPRPGKSDGPSPPAARGHTPTPQTPGVTLRPDSRLHGLPINYDCRIGFWLDI